MPKEKYRHPGCGWQGVECVEATRLGKIGHKWPCQGDAAACKSDKITAIHENVIGGHTPNDSAYYCYIALQHTSKSEFAMLYQLYESQRSLMEPFSDMAYTAAKIFNNPLLPLGQMPYAQRVSAGYALIHRLGKDYEKPEFGIRTVDVDGVDVAIHERVEIDKPFCELRRFKRFSDDPATLNALKIQPAVLIVAPLSGHHATLLRDTVKTMLKDHKVYITDWKNARTVPLSEGEFHLDDYVNYIQEFIRHLQKA